MAGFILTSHGNRLKNQEIKRILKFPSLHMGSFENDVRNLMLRIFVIIFLGVLKMGDPQVTIGFNTKSWSNDLDILDDLGVPP